MDKTSFIIINTLRYTKRIEGQPTTCVGKLTVFRITAPNMLEILPGDYSFPNFPKNVTAIILFLFSYLTDYSRISYPHIAKCSFRTLPLSDHS